MNKNFYELVKVFHEHQAVVFVGAGASLSAGLPGWDKLVSRLAERLENLREGPLDADTLLKIPQYYLNEFGRREFAKVLGEELLKKGLNRRDEGAKYRDRPVHRLLTQLPIKTFYTTNFDTLLEDEFAEQGIEINVIHSEALAIQHTERTGTQVRKIHGTIKGGDWDDLVLARSDYAQLPMTRPTLFQALAEDLKSNSFLFIGYSLRDPDFGAIYNNVLLTMQGKHKSHYVALVDDPGAHEIRDLKERGLIPIDVWNYPGTDRNEKLISFLNCLLDETSDLIHLRRFFIGAEGNIPIIITSRLHEIENYVFYPASDIHAARQLRDDIARLGVNSTIVPDKIALKECKRYLAGNLILVCGPGSGGNQFTRHFFQAAASTDASFRSPFLFRDEKVYLQALDGRLFGTDNLTEGGSTAKTEYALIARFRNPWADSAYIYLFAGLQALGTHAIGEYLRGSKAYRQLNRLYEGTGDLIAILPLIYRELDPFDYRFEMGELIKAC